MKERIFDPELKREITCITKLKVREEHIPAHRSHNPIELALYRGIKNHKDPDYFYGDYQGHVRFDVINDQYIITTGEYHHHKKYIAGPKLKMWLNAWNHNLNIFPITIQFNFKKSTAEIIEMTTSQMKKYWRSNGTP